jgi:protein-tyrosine phosphatase
MALLLQDDRPLLRCAPNFRDVGGLPVEGGGRVAHGHLFRSEAIGEVGPEDAAHLADCGIDVLLDLRSAGERRKAPQVWWHTRAVRIEEVDVTADMRAMASPWTPMIEQPGEIGARAMMIGVYRRLPAASRDAVRAAIAIFARGEALLIHCTAGKDRTGFVVAVVLAAIGVPWRAILGDYMLSGEQPNPHVVATSQAMIAQGIGRDPDAATLAAVTGVRPEYLETAFAALREGHGGVTAYLGEAGIGPEVIAALRARLIDQPGA